MSNSQKIFLPVALMSLIALSMACHKNSVEPEPAPHNPDVPTDTITPVNPGDTVVPTTGGKIANFYYRGGSEFPLLDSIRYYANDPEYDSIYIKWHPVAQNYWSPRSFHIARDSLQKRFNISSKVRGGWWVMPYQILPDCDSTNIGVKGLIRQDSVWYADRHYVVLPVIGSNSKTNTQPTYNGNRMLKAGRSR